MAQPGASRSVKYQGHANGNTVDKTSKDDCAARCLPVSRTNWRRERLFGALPAHVQRAAAKKHIRLAGRAIFKVALRQHCDTYQFQLPTYHINFSQNLLDGRPIKLSCYPLDEAPKKARRFDQP